MAVSFIALFAIGNIVQMKGEGVCVRSTCGGGEREVVVEDYVEDFLGNKS